MPEPPNDRQEALDQWLDRAMAGLCAEARTRIRAEIEAHFTDALAAAREADRPEAEARQEALCGLGSPRVAARRFRKTFLGDQELKLVEKWRQYRQRALWKKLGVPLVYLACVVWMIYVVLFGDTKAMQFMFGLVTLTNIHSLWEKMTDCLMSSVLFSSRIRHPRRWLLIASAAHLALWGWVLDLVIRIGSPVHDWSPWLINSAAVLIALSVFLGITYDSIRFLDILRKTKNGSAPHITTGPDQYA